MKQEAPAPRTVVAPIADSDLDRVGRFLHEHLDPRVSAETWASAAVPSWQAPVDDHGFLLAEGDRVVGVYLALHSERMVGGERRHVCNLAAWCVLESHRAHGVRLLRAQLARKDVVFTDLSPSGSVPELNRRLGFTDLDTTTVVVPCVPLPAPGVRVVTRPSQIDAMLDGRDREIYRDHREAAAAQHVVLAVGGAHCYVMFRKVRRKGHRGFATLLHVSDPDLLRGHLGAISRHLLRHGVVVLLAELRVIQHAPRLSRRLSAPRPKMYRGAGAAPEDIDDLYSELTNVPW
ncbi:hypothetical protein GCM10023350_53960 [Nocardioides endophyticus]|uniref:N-acetyltransferase domain-containing protein n=1 Tax=Nocardioides endophyticus TaxID=1353775 RepID=A0ABP8ZP49_9ACTN